MCCAWRKRSCDDYDWDSDAIVESFPEASLVDVRLATSCVFVGMRVGLSVRMSFVLDRNASMTLCEDCMASGHWPEWAGNLEAVREWHAQNLETKKAHSRGCQ